MMLLLFHVVSSPLTTAVRLADLRPALPAVAQDGRGALLESSLNTNIDDLGGGYYMAL